MKNCEFARINALPIVVTACLALAAVQPLAAANACPVRLSDGQIENGTISIRFMNQGKTPIREMNLDCSNLQGARAARVGCHNESGVFYPGTPYALKFPYTGKASRSIEVTVDSVRLQDGTLWTSSQDQPCRPLKVVQK